MFALLGPRRPTALVLRSPTIEAGKAILATAWPERGQIGILHHAIPDRKKLSAKSTLLRPRLHPGRPAHLATLDPPPPRMCNMRARPVEEPRSALSCLSKGSYARRSSRGHRPGFVVAAHNGRCRQHVSTACHPSAIRARSATLAVRSPSDNTSPELRGLAGTVSGRDAACPTAPLPALTIVHPLARRSWHPSGRLAARRI